MAYYQILSKTRELYTLETQQSLSQQRIKIYLGMVSHTLAWYSAWYLTDCHESRHISHTGISFSILNYKQTNTSIDHSLTLLIDYFHTKLWLLQPFLKSEHFESSNATCSCRLAIIAGLYLCNYLNILCYYLQNEQKME